MNGTAIATVSVLITLAQFKLNAWFYLWSSQYCVFVLVWFIAGLGDIA